MPSPGTEKRIARIRRRAIPAVREAFEAGNISARRADTLLYLPARQQAEEMDALLRARQDRQGEAKTVAQIIERYLATLEGRKVDLAKLNTEIRAALTLRGSSNNS